LECSCNLLPIADRDGCSAGVVTMKHDYEYENIREARVIDVTTATTATTNNPLA
jgi:hypothetical protein